MAVDVGMPPSLRGAYRAPKHRPSFDQRPLAADPALHDDPYAHPDWLRAYRRPPSPIANGSFVPRPRPARQRSRSLVNGVDVPPPPTAARRRSSSVPVRPIVSAKSTGATVVAAAPLSETRSHRRDRSGGSSAIGSSPLSSASSASTAPTRASSRSRQSKPPSPLSSSSALAPAAPAHPIAPAAAPAPPPVCRSRSGGKLTKQRRLERRTSVIERVNDPKAAPITAPRKRFWQRSSAVPPRDDEPVDVTALEHAPSVRTRAGSTRSSFIVVGGGSKEPQLLFAPIPPVTRRSPPTGLTIQEPTVVPPSIAPSVISATASKNMARSRDNIDQLDQTDPLGLGWHNSSPYDAISSMVDSSVAGSPRMNPRSHKAGGSSQPSRMAPSSVGGSSVYPNQRMFAGVGAHHPRSSVASPYPAHMPFIPEALPAAQAQAYAASMAGSHARADPRRGSMPPPAAHSRVSVDSAASRRPMSQQHPPPSRMPEPQLDGRGSHDPYSYGQPMPGPHRHSQSQSPPYRHHPPPPVEPEYDPYYDGGSPPRAADDGAHWPDAVHSDIGHHGYADKPYGDGARQPLAPRSNDGHGASYGSPPLIMLPGGGGGGSRGPASVLSGSSGGMARGPLPPHHRPRRLVMPGALAGGAPPPPPLSTAQLQQMQRGRAPHDWHATPSQQQQHAARGRSPFANPPPPPMPPAGHYAPQPPPPHADRGGRLTKRRGGAGEDVRAGMGGSPRESAVLSGVGSSDHSARRLSKVRR